MATQETTTQDAGTYLFRDGGGRVFEVDTLLLAATEWESRPERGDSAWAARPLAGGLVLAVRLNF